MSIPTLWETASLGEIADLIRGVTFQSRTQAYEPSPDRIACLRTTNVQREVEWDDLWFINREAVRRPEQLLRSGDVLISTANSRELVGKVAFLGSLRTEATLGAFIGVIRSSPHMDARFVYYQLAYQRTQETIRAMASTTTNISNVSMTKVADLRLTIPPLAEQHRIVAEIEKQLTRIDAAVTALERTRANLRRYRASVLKAAVEGRLVKGPVLTEDEELVEEAAAAGFEIESSVDLPGGWGWARLGSIAAIGTGATPLRSNGSYYGGDIPWITSGALNSRVVRAAEEYITPLALKETNAKVFPAGSLLIAMYGEGKTRGKMSELSIDAATNQACAAAVFSEHTQPFKPFVKVFLQKHYDDLRRESSGGVQPNLNLSLIKNILIPLAPRNERELIVAEVERRLSVIDELEVMADHALKRADRLRQSVLKRAFEGRLVAQDPRDEPASVLLERIRAERAAAPITVRGRTKRILAEAAGA